eukprot:UN04227
MLIVKMICKIVSFFVFSNHNRLLICFLLYIKWCG